MNRLTAFYTGNRQIFSMIFHLAWPAIVEQLFQTIVQYIDTAMVGRIGAQASAAVGLTSSVTWLVNSPLFAMGIGVLSCIAVAVGSGDHQRAKEYGVQSLTFIVTLGIGMGVLLVGISPFLPAWMGADPAIRRDASVYFGIICAPMLFRAASIILGSVMRGAGDAKSPMIANILLNLTNVVLNFLLIYDSRTVTLGGMQLWIPGAGLGVAGAAIGTAASYCVGGTFMVIAYLRNPILSPRGLSLRPQPSLLRNCLRIGLPVAMERLSTCLGHVVFVSMVTRLGTLALATHSIAITAEQAFYVPGFGMQAAASTLAGNCVGERDQEKFKRVTGIITGIAVAMMTVTGALLFLFPEFMMSLFTTDPQVISGGIHVLRIVAVSEPMYGAMIVLEGVFNGIGDTRIPFLISLFAMWAVRILGTCCVILLFGGGLEMVWVCMVADNITRCLCLTLRFMKGSWKYKFEA